MVVDWLKIKTEYINGEISYRKLAEKHGVSFNTLKDHAVAEEWARLRTESRHNTTTATQRKIVEKTSEALSEEAAAKVRIKATMMRLAEDWFVKQEKSIMEGETGGINPSDFHKMVQSCVDLGVLEVQEAEESDSDGLLDALGKNAASVFLDGDDSDMLPED